MYNENQSFRNLKSSSTNIDSAFSIETIGKTQL